ncbi:hypothetical protein ABBQ32_001532 [Trebouxia sp. C0010 RCD-2024]
MTGAGFSTRLVCVWIVHLLATGAQAARQASLWRAPLNDTQQDTAADNSFLQGKGAPTGDDDSQYFALCVAAKDQHLDIDEWVVHHQKLGAGRIYVYDDNSDPPMRDQLQRHIQSGLVDYHFIGRDNHTTIERPQLWVYNECIQQYRNRHKFIAFIDVDEFLFLRDPSFASMPALLRQYEDYGGLAVNWILFGSSGHIHRPKGGTLANYWKCVPLSHPENLHVKTIANMKYVAHTSGTPHFFFYNEGKAAVNEKFEVVEGARTHKNMIDRVAIYHYVTKSKEEFGSKTARGSGMKNRKQVGFFDAIERYAVDDCRDGMLWAQRQQSRNTSV